VATTAFKIDHYVSILGSSLHSPTPSLSVSTLTEAT
jgi:hypothetical protein